MSDSMSRRDFLKLSAIVALEGALLTAGVPRSIFAASTGTNDLLNDELAYLSAGEQIQRFHAGTLSPVDVLEAQIARIEKYNGPLNLAGDEIPDYMNFNSKVNAITVEHFAEARKAAKEAEKRYRAGTARSLEGITVAIKDENDVKGWRVTMGSTILKDGPLSEENTAIIDFLLAEGAILHIQTTVPEFYLHTQTWSKLWGVTRNPWNLYYAVGGSSGGSGASLAAGFSTLATGSDMGGSIRIPASMCGTYGFKPPFGRVPTSEISFETLGPLTRTFEDLALMQNTIVGPHPTVHASLRPKLVYPQQYDSLKGVKIALDYFEDWIEEGVDSSVRKAMADAADVLRSQGAVVDEVKLGWRYDDMFPIFVNGLLSTSMGQMLLAASKYKDQTTSYAAKFIESMGAMGPGELAKSDDLTTLLHRQLQDELFDKDYRALIMSTLLTPYFPADNDPTRDTVNVNGKPVKGTRFTLTIPWNLLSRYPVVDVPVAVADNNIPIGMQVIGNTFDDLAAFQVAYGYSKAGLRLYDGRLFPDFGNRK